MIVNHGMSLRRARTAWLRLGGTVRIKRRTGEELYQHPDLVKAIIVNLRRRDAPRVLTTALRKLGEL